MLVTNKKFDLDHFKVPSNNSVGKIILITHAQKFPKVVWALQSLKNILLPKFLIDVYYALIYSHL